ncbi:MAG: leucyl aminopeptidase family protein [Betaproteobacteria bacterium]|nr:leucyl aminopeptidase family protein [Betaproteobacteria bacterium]
MLAKIKTHSKQITEDDLTTTSHHLILLQGSDCIPEALASSARLKGSLMRRDMLMKVFVKTPILTENQAGGLVVWLVLDLLSSRFAQMEQVRKAVMLLLAESPDTLSLAAFGEADFCHAALCLAVYVSWINGEKLPNYKTDKPSRSFKKMQVFGVNSAGAFAHEHALAAANVLSRTLTATPGNQLTPRVYRKKIAELAQIHGWQTKEHDQKALRKLGAGAFLAVAQGSQDDEAAIVYLRRHVAGAKKTVALVGKGICFDTGGHQLKPAKYMLGMHEDMAGSAVALSILQAATELNLPVNLEVWLAIAENHLGPLAYKPGDVVTALNGTTIEMMHTDAEGRLVLADTLSLAARNQPDVMVDFATLTGSMVTALGTRYSGVLGNNETELARALAAGVASGERLCAFPMDDDYAPALDSEVADIKQCLLEGEADHILAACFLKRFVSGIPWLHVDLSAANSPKGLGGVDTEVTGFGVAWGIHWLESQC